MGRDAMRQGRLEETEHLFLAGMPFAPGTWGRLFGACIQRDMAGAFIYGSQIEKARAQLVELLAAYDDLRDRQGSAARHLLIGLTQLELGRYDAVRHHAERALTVCREYAVYVDQVLPGDVLARVELVNARRYAGARAVTSVPASGPRVCPHLTGA